MRLPHARSSNVVIVGASNYDDPGLHDLPAVRNNVRDLRSLLTDRRHGIVADDRCDVVLNIGIRDTIRIVREHAEAATDTLVIYFAGHGLMGDDDSLFLSMRDTASADLALSALAFDQVRRAVHASPAQYRAVILDCCFSGRAVERMGAGGAADALFAEGSYVLTATTANRLARAPEGRTHTAFTGELVKLLRDGVDDGPEMLSIHYLYGQVRTAMRASEFPEPANLMSGTAEQIVLSRNRWTGRRPAATKPAPAKPAAVRPPATKPATIKAPVKPATAKPPTIRTPVKPSAAKAAAGPTTVKAAVKPAPPGPAAVRPVAALVTAPRPAAAKPPAKKYVALPRLMFCHDGATLITTGRDNLIRVWDVTSRRLRHTFSGHTGTVAQFAVGVNGSMLATAASDRAIRLWNLHDGRQTGRIDTTARWLALHPAEPLLAVIGKEATAEIFDLRNLRRVRTLRGHTGEVLRVGLSHDGSRVLTTGSDRTLRVWDTRSGQQLTVLDGVASPRLAAFHTAAGWVATSLASGGIRLRRLAGGEKGGKIADLPGDGTPTELMASRDGRVLAVLDADGRVRTYDIPARRPLLDLAADGAQPVSRILFGAGRTLVTLTDGGVARLLDCRSGKVRRTLRDASRSSLWLTFDPTGNHAAVGRRDHTTHLYDLRTDGEPQPLRPVMPRSPAPKPRPADTVRRTSTWADDLLRSAYERLRIGTDGHAL
ncbi:caspase family protein [Actinoplanes sp. NPDC023801]|uniref:caspase, EACC1-associated type n=1 Tax=Actinoplanes sp. NPDC023801 TaxID=3154595 RepID=UPI0033CD0D94